jgi:kumamolisin
MKNTFLRYLRCLALFIVMITINTHAASDMTSDPSSVRLSGHIPSQMLTEAVFLKSLDPNSSIPITFVLPLRDPKALDELIKQIYDPTDLQHYGNYLTSEEFTKRFAPTQEDYDTVIAYAKQLGLDIIGTHPNRTLLNVKGTAQSMQEAFKLNLQLYQHANGRQFHAPDKDPEVPMAIANIINGIVGLDNAAVWHALNQRKEAIGASNSSAFPSGPLGGFAPKDIAIAYNLSGVPVSGSGQTIALFELSAYQASDILAYTNYFGLPAPKLNTILVDGGSGSSIDAEVTLDIQLALALAPQSQIYVYEGPNSGQGVLDTYNRIATDNIAKQVSSSWGLGENYVSSQSLQAENAIFQQMAAQGQSIFCAAGDSGAYEDYPNMTLVVLDPAAQPYMVAVGGTSLTVNASTGAYVSETVWNNGLGKGAGGGGVSNVWPIPSWQTNISTAFSKTNRNVPDISLNANPNTGYAVFYNGQWTIYGGTSCAAPLWAAFTALVNEQRQSAQMPTLGFANPTLYSIASVSEATDYHDITSGNNLYYQAGPGYDNATGWGTFNGGNLFASLTQTSPDVPSVNITSPTNGSTVSGILTIAATASDAMGIAHVDFYVDSTLIASVTKAPYTASLNTSTLTNGTHSLSAIAFNTLGNSAKSVVSITVNNAMSSSIYFNAGNGAVTDTCTGVAWQADEFYSGGNIYTNSGLPTCLGVYASERVGNFSYNIPISNGKKFVILKFAEIYYNTIGARIFDVNINGTRVVSNLDIFKEVGFAKPLDLSFPVTVTNNSVQITFVPVVDNPKISGIEILSR